MKIAYLTSIYARASDTFIRNEVIELRARGHEVFTFSIRREANDQNVSTEVAAEQSTTDYILEKSPLTLILTFFAVFFKSPFQILSAFKLAWKTRALGLRGAFLQLAYLVEAAYLAHRMQAVGIEIVHNHIAENSANVAMLSSAMSGIPYSMTVHGPGIFFHPKHWALGEKIARSAFTATITSFCKSQCMLFSDAQFWHKLHIVRCSVGKSFDVSNIQPIPEAPRLVFVGRLCAEKGLPILVEAVAQHVEAGGKCELVLIGDGPLRKEIETIIERRKLQGAIKILGWKGSVEVRAEIERCRALVLPSFAEGLPVVIMEAFALGRPVVTTQIAGIPELVIDQVNGWLVPAGSVERLVQALGQVTMATPSAIQQMGERASVRLRELHDFNTEVDKLESLFKAAIKSS